VWGHSTGATQDNIRTFFGRWTGTATIQDSGDTERIRFAPGQYMQSEIANPGSFRITLSLNVYRSGDSVTLKYRTAATIEGIESAEWIIYTGAFQSSGYVQLRLEG
jgi:hypothetical protein